MTQTTQLWVDAYSPSTIEDCILPSSLKAQLTNIIEKADIPNLLLVGEAGTGKTTTARILCDTLGFEMLFINASSERGINTIQNQVTGFASTASLFGEAGYKAILLDEADNLTPDAQKALRGLVEQFQNHCRFILTCNYPEKLISPLRSRMTTIDFGFEAEADTLRDAFYNRITSILETEEVVLTNGDEDTLRHLVSHNYPNFRKCIHQLQQSVMDGGINQDVILNSIPPSVDELIPLLESYKMVESNNWLNRYFETTTNASCLNLVDALFEALTPSMTDDNICSIALILGKYSDSATRGGNQRVLSLAMIAELTKVLSP
jgi:DNA polymerase III delta prime subunit